MQLKNLIYFVGQKMSGILDTQNERNQINILEQKIAN